MIRRIHSHEAKLVSALLRLAGENDPKWDQQVANAVVEPLKDGGMGSFRFGAKDEKRVFGRELARAEALDKDDIRVEIALIADNNDDLFELEVWKVNFAPVVALPEPDSLNAVRDD